MKTVRSCHIRILLRQILVRSLLVSVINGVILISCICRTWAHEILLPGTRSRAIVLIKLLVIRLLDGRVLLSLLGHRSAQLLMFIEFRVSPFAARILELLLKTALNSKRSRYIIQLLPLF